MHCRKVSTILTGSIWVFSAPLICTSSCGSHPPVVSRLTMYESKGLIRVERDFGNRRNYSEQDVEWVKFLLKLKKTGMTILDIKQYSDLRYEGESTIAKRLAILKKHEIYVEEQRKLWQEYAQNLTDKIEWYQKQL
jgi:DNA-binding transcriptional MerR regulator